MSEPVKDLELVGRLQGWLEGGLAQGPYTLQLSPTMACDLNCEFCRRQEQLKGFYGAQSEIANERYLKMVASALEMGAKVFIIKGGGEPLLRRSLLLELAPLIKRAGAYGNIVTNGTHLDEPLRRMFAACGWDDISISLDGPDAETHDRIRAKKGTFDRVMRHVDALNALKTALGAERPKLTFHCVLTKLNYDRFDRFIELAADKRAHRLELDSLSPRYASSRFLEMDEAATRDFLERLPRTIEALDRKGLSHNFGDFKKPEVVQRAATGAGLYEEASRKKGPAAARLPCYYPFYQASITPAGHIVPCCYAEETHRSETNLGRTDFRQAWLAGDPQRYRQSMQTGTMMPFCKDCTALYADNNARLRRWLIEEAQAHAR